MNRVLPLLLVATFAAAAIAADDPVTITRKPPTTHTRTFDPASPPADVHLSGNEAAYTRSSFYCQAGLSYVVTDHRPASGGKTVATVRVDAVQMELSLDDTYFLPKGASKKLVDHEHAHRQIAERVYESAGDVARALAAPLVGRTYTATGDTPESAGEHASHAVIQKLCDDYMATIPARSSTVNDAFDRITDHGRNRVPESDAVELSFRETPAAKSR